MKILLIDSDGAMLDFNLRCQKWKHEIKHFIGNRRNNEYSTVGDGLIDRVQDYKKWLRWADLIVLGDNNRYIRDLETFRDYGYPIFGPNLEVTKWEMQREYGQEVMRHASGIKPVPFKMFTDYDSAINYVKSSKLRLVSKPCADADKSLSYCAKSAKDMLWTLENWKKQNGKPSCPFILQEFAPGIEMAIGGYFGSGGFSEPLTLSFEFKKHMPDNWGKNTGEMGTVMAFVKSEKLAEQALFPLEKRLHQAKYTGYIDVAFMIPEKGDPNFLEFTSRFGWPLTHLQSALIKGDPAAWMGDLLDGRDTIEYSEQVCSAFVLAHGDFPCPQPSDELEGIPVYADWSNRDLHPSQIKLGKAPNEMLELEDCRVSAGNYLLVATGTADNVRTSVRRAYRNLKSVEVPGNLQARDDIGERLEEELPLLQARGYAKGIEY